MPYAQPIKDGLGFHKVWTRTSGINMDHWDDDHGGDPCV